LGADEVWEGDWITKVEDLHDFRTLVLLAIFVAYLDFIVLQIFAITLKY
jgi:hypothetical protein